MSNWAEKIEVYQSANSGAATLGAMIPAGKQLRINTDVAWTNDPLQVWANNDVIQAVISPFGGHYRIVSDASLTEWGGYSDDEALVAFSRSNVAGEPTGHRIFLSVSESSFDNIGEFNARGRKAGANDFEAGFTLTGKVGSTLCLGTMNASNTSGAQMQLSFDGTNDSVCAIVCSPTSGLSIDCLGFKAQVFDHVLKFSDEDGLVTRFSPFVADGASAVAYLFDTSNTLSDDAARLFVLNNNGSNRLFVNHLGCIGIGPSLVSSWGEPSGGESFVSVRDSTAGELNTNQIAIVTIPAVSQIRQAYLLCDSNSVDLSLSQTTTSTSAWDITAGNTHVSCIATVADTTRCKLRPTEADGATAEAYLFDTSNALANAGARIVSFEIQGTRKSSIDVNGAYFVGANQVVGARVVDARIDDAINSGDATTDGVIDACRDALIAHGLCTAA